MSVRDLNRYYRLSWPCVVGCLENREAFLGGLKQAVPLLYAAVAVGQTTSKSQEARGVCAVVKIADAGGWKSMGREPTRKWWEERRETMEEVNEVKEGSGTIRPRLFATSPVTGS